MSRRWLLSLLCLSAADFKFRPRFALTAKAAPSVVYDYYNPDARAVVAPVRFLVK